MNGQLKNDKSESETVSGSCLDGWAKTLRTVTLGAGCLLFIGTLFVAWHYWQKRHGLQVELVSLESQLAELTELSGRLQVARPRVNDDKQVIEKFMRLCRDANDVPNWECDRIISGYLDMLNTAIYVPDGQHVLTVFARWKVTNVPVAEQAENHQIWQVPLLGNSGYWFEVLCESPQSSVQWRLSSNHPDFEVQGDSLPFGRWSKTSQGRFSSEPIKFPNEIENAFEEIKNPSKLLKSSVKVLNLRLNGSSELGPVEVTIDAMIFSEGPPVVAASKADELLLLRPTAPLRYIGKGRYSLEVE